MDSTNINPETMYSATKDPLFMKSATTYLVTIVSIAMESVTMYLATMGTAKIHIEKWTPQRWTM